MDLPHYKILAADLSKHAIVTIDCPSCRILSQIPYPESLLPINLVTTQNGKKAYIPANDATYDKGYLFVLNLAANSLYQLPLDMPPIKQFALSHNGTSAYIVDASNTLYHFDTASLTFNSWGCPGMNASCNGIIATATNIYTIWEDSSGGTLLCFDLNGQPCHECTFSAIPTSITVTSSNTILITFTSGKDAGEGVVVLDPLKEEPVVITTLCPNDLISHQNYPIHIAPSSDGESAYIVNEDSASISIIDIKKYIITGNIIVGRAISRLYILPNSLFALASSSLFADLILIDLVNKKVLSATMPQHEIYPYIALLPD